jgi:hypothetical protein
MMATSEQTPPPSRAEERQAPPDVATSRDVGAGAAELPPLLTPSEVARACRMSRRAANGLLIGAGIAERNEESGRWFVSSERLRARLPDVYARVRTLLLGGRDAV